MLARKAPLLMATMAHTSDSCGNLDFHNNSVTRRGGNHGYYTFYINAGGAITVRNNSFADYNNGYGCMSMVFGL